MRRRNRARAAGCAGAFDARFGSAWLPLTGVVLPGLLPVLGVGIGGGAFWTALGWPLARRVLPADIPVLCGAPALGWCVHTALSLSVLPLMAFDRWHVVLVAWLVACPMIGLAMQGGGSDTRAPWWLAACAGVVALGPMAGVLPHLAGGVVSLSMPMFDHSKIAIVDAVAREGVPAANAFYGGGEAGAHLTYYWWWHASAAEVARVAGVSGWAADAALTWFTAAASMLLMAGIAWGLGGRGAAVLAMLISLPGSLHPWLGWLEQAGWLRGGSGLGGWLNQASWAPQHLAAGSALVVAALLLAGWADGAVLVRSVSLGCVVAAAFGSSVWVGGVTCAVALPVAAAVVLRRLPAAARPRAILWSVLAAAMALALVAGLVRDEWAGARLRGGGLPVMLAPYPVFGTAVPGWLRPIADAGGFAWLLLIEFPAIAVPVALGGWRVARVGAGWRGGLLGLGGGALLVGAWLRSTIDNNDLGWRAMVPALLVFTPVAAAVMGRWLRAGGARAVFAMLPGLLGAGDAWALLRDNAVGDPRRGDPVLLRSAAAWEAVRALVPPEVRVANDLSLAGRMTLWPANIGWALLAGRPSCYSGWATAHALVPLPAAALYRTELELDRVFAGVPAAGDVADMAGRLRCGAVLLLPGEPAWTHDPFAGSDVYRLAATTPGWRIYLAPPRGPASAR